MTRPPGHRATPPASPVTEPATTGQATVIQLAAHTRHPQRPARAPAPGTTDRLREPGHAATAGPAPAPPVAAPAADGLNRRGDEHAQAARSVTCPCGAQPGSPCRPAGDHLARYLHAGQSGAISRAALNNLVTGLDVISARRIITAPAEQAARLAGAKTADQIVRAQLDAGMTADRIETRALHVLAGRHDHPTPVSEAFFGGFDDVTATYTREARELEAGA